MAGIAAELEDAAAPELSEEDAALLSGLVEAPTDVAMDLRRKGEKVPYGFERGGESAWAMTHKSAKGASQSMQRRYSKLQKRGLVKLGSGGEVSVTKRGSAALKKYQHSAGRRLQARGKGHPISPSGKPVKLKPGEKMVFGRIVKAG